MKLTPSTQEEYEALSDSKAVRRRIRELVDTNPIIKKAWAIADINKLSELDRYTLLAFHAIILAEEAIEQGMKLQHPANEGEFSFENKKNRH
jgi:hypothetical protein